MTCRDVKKIVYLFREGEIPEDTRRAVLQHAASCRRCADELRQANSAGMHVADLRQVEPRLYARRDLTNQIMRGIDTVRTGTIRLNPPTLRPFRRLQLACTAVAAVIVAAFFLQNAVDVHRMTALESRIDQFPVVWPTSVDEPPLAALGLSTVSHIGRLLSPASDSSEIGLRGRQQLRQAVRSFFDILQAGPPAFAGEVQRLRAKYPEIWLISPLDGLTSRDRLVLSRQGKPLLKDLRTLLQPGGSNNEQ
jgi:hypothetical protein